MENPNIKYSVEFLGNQPVLITAMITMNDGEVIKHTRNIAFSEAKAIAEAYNTLMR